VTIDNEVTIILRELCPSDFYWFSLVENDYPDITPDLLGLMILVMLTDLPEEDAQFDLIRKKSIAPLISWMMKELVQEKVMNVEQWMEMCFHLCKQRWDSSMEWLEQQPMSKVLLMVRVQSGFNIAQEREMKKASRKK